MKWLVLSLLIFFVHENSTAQNVGKKELKAITSTHHVIAIMPALVTLKLRPEEKAATNADQVKDAEMKMGFMIQAYLCQAFIEKADKYHFTILFENPKETNDSLFRMGRSFDAFKTLPADSLSAMSDADVIMIETATVSQLMDIGVSKELNTIGALSGLLFNRGFLLPGNTRVGMTIQLVDKASGRVFWQRECALGYFAADTFEGSLINIVMAAAKDFPYRK